MKKFCTILAALTLAALCIVLMPQKVEAATSGYYTYTVSGGQATITDVRTYISGKVTIPSTLGGYPVTSIGDSAFRDCSSLTSVTIPNSVTSIGVYAFASCSNLTSVTIPNSVTSIGDEAFFYCSSLTSVTIPNSVTSIGNSAFHGCSSLTNVTIPNSVTSIGDDAFYNCSSLIGIRVDAGNRYYSSDSQGVLYNQEKTMLIQAPNAMKSCVIPNSVTSIGDDAFYGCNSLTSVTIPNSVTSIGASAFLGCHSLTSVTIPNSVTSIGASAFLDCYSLTSVTIPNSVTSIGNYAFNYCSSLTSVTIPSGVTSIGDSPFSGCRSLIGIEVDAGNPNYSSDSQGVLYNQEKTMLIQAPGAMKSCVIPNSVTSIGNAAFYGCRSLTSMTIPSSVTSIGNAAFSYCRSLTSVTIPNSVTSIGDDAFWYCSSLTSVTIPNSVTSIGDSAFCDCSSLTSVTIPNSVTSIGNYAFNYCSSLTSVTILNGVTSIGNYAFCHCSSLTSVTIPNSVTSIGNYAFDYCSSLTSVTYCGTEEQWSAIKIGNANGELNNAERSYHTLDGDHSWVAATCTTAKICSICGLTEGEALGHSWVTGSCIKPTTCSTCGETGEYVHIWLDATCSTLQQCFNCGATQGNYAEHTWTDATCTTLKTCVECGATEGNYAEHTWTDATCTTLKTCVDCGATTGDFSDHTYDNDADNVCNLCGHLRPVAAAELQFFADAGLSFQDYIGMQILIKNSLKTGYDKVYVEISQLTPDGIVTNTTEGVVYLKNYTVFEQQIVSWSMTEQVTMTLYAEKDGVTYQGASFTTTVKDLAMDKLPIYKAQNDMARCKALVDMLNYGAAVQSAYDYNAGNLANADLGEYAELGTQDVPDITAENNITGTNAIKVYSANISLQDNVEFQFMVKTSALNGKTVKATLDGTAVDVAYTEYGNYTVIRVAAAAAHMRSTYTIVVNDANGNPVTCTYNVSVEAYAKDKLGDEKAEAYIAMMRYGDAVAAIG